MCALTERPHHAAKGMSSSHSWPHLACLAHNTAAAFTSLLLFLVLRHIASVFVEMAFLILEKFQEMMKVNAFRFLRLIITPHYLQSQFDVVSQVQSHTS